MPFMRTPKDVTQGEDAGSLLLQPMSEGIESHITFTPEKRFPKALRHPAKTCLQTCTETTRHSGGALLFDSQPAQLGKQC
jgi:hypothetical protein